MKKNVKSATAKVSAEDKAMDAFADVLIKHLESVEVGDWTKPWNFSGESVMWPQNLDGREYGASNALILMMHTQQNGFKAPIYATFDRIVRMNFADAEKKKRVTDAEGNPLPQVKVNAGTKCMPVVNVSYTPVHKETHEKIAYAKYMELSEEERKQYDVFPRTFYYYVLNIDQTNLKESRPELYERLIKLAEKPHVEGEAAEEVKIPAVDAMVMKNLWQCPISVQYSDSAYYSPNADRIVVPQKSQFANSEAFYGTLFHECAHSTGAKFRYDRGLGARDRKKYAREELVAELTAALVMSRFGLVKYTKSDSLPYLKAWLGSLKEEPKFIKELLNDVKKAASQINRRLDVIQKRIEELRDMGVPEPEYYPDFLELNPVTNQPICDPGLYRVKESVEKEEEVETEA